MARIPLPGADDDLTAEQRRVYENMAGLRGGRVPAHYRATLCNPELTDKWQQIGELLRYRTSLPVRLSELAILVTAYHQRCDYQWIMHEPVALKSGLPREVADAVRAGERPTGAADDELAIFDYCASLLGSRFVDDRTYGQTVAVVGERGIAELTALIGYYVMVAMAINAHELPLPPDAEPVFGT